MLLGQTITVWTDHRNLTYKNTEHASDRVLRQRLLLEEYTVNLKFIQGIKNEAADIISRNELIFEPTKKASTGKFEELVHEVQGMEMTVPVFGLILRVPASETSAKRSKVRTKQAVR